MLESKIDHYRHDISKMGLLEIYLDANVYPLITERTGVVFSRKVENDLQHEGIDLIGKKGEEVLLIDEKAQLEFLNTDMPTLAFEISSVINGVKKEGWLFDTRKRTERYFYVTAIYSRNKNGEIWTLQKPKDIEKCEIWAIDRKALVEWLMWKGITKELCVELGEKNPVSAHIEFPEIKIKKQIYLT